MISILMQIIAIVAGVAVGSWIGWRIADFSLLLLFLGKYRSEAAYLALYDLLDDEHGYKLFQSHMKTVDSYTTYLRLHQKARSKAYDMFRDYYADTVKFIVWHILLLVLITFVFWTNWRYYLVTVLVTLFCWLGYKRFFKGYGVDFYARLMMSGVLSEYSEQQR